MKYAIIVPDGMADEPLAELNQQTPLEVAKTPNMDNLAKSGMVGLVKTIPDNFPPGSDIGNMALMGYNPAECHTGRAPLEAANQGIMLNDHQVAIRCNLVTINAGIMIDYSAGHIQTDDAKKVVDVLNQKLANEKIHFHLGKSYRHTLIIESENAKEFYDLKTTPPHDILNKAVQDYLPTGKQAEILNNLINQAREALIGVIPQVTDIWLWGQGTKPQMPSFNEKYGLNAAMISAVDLVNGLGKLADFTIIDVPGITGYYDTNYEGKGQYAIEALKKHDLVYVHIEAPDEAGHNGDYKEKIKAIENIDKHIVGPMINFINAQNGRILVSPDHPTPVAIRTHTRKPVPFVISGKGITHNNILNLSEQTATDSKVLINSGEELIQTFLKES